MKTLQLVPYLLLLFLLTVTQTLYPLAFAYAQEEGVSNEVSSDTTIVGTQSEDTSNQEDEPQESDVYVQEEDEGQEEYEETTDTSPEEQGTHEENNDVEQEDPDDESVIEQSSKTVMSAASSSPQASSTMDSVSTSTQTPSISTTTTASTTASSSDQDVASSTSNTQTTTIVSGQAVALANILNMVNSNFVNSEGVVLFSNFFETVYGAIDFRQYFAPFAEFGCSLVTCQGQNVAVNINNNASIDNEVVLSATSGGNEISDTEHGSIDTGDAYAGLNLINVANTNLVDSNYLLVTLNAFEGVNGDIVFPSLSQFFSSLSHGASTPQTIDIENTADVENEVSVDANAGGNTISGTESSTITTGDAVGGANVFNQLNASLVGGQSVAIVFRVHGSWAGEVFGAPDDLAWTVGDDGSMYLFDVGSTLAGGELAMAGTSTASIRNNVSVVALTGENSITNAETAVISTGNAYAGANVINVANANVVGRNWILAVINIFGDFNGNIAFGRPDLWVGGQIDVPASVENGTELDYTFTIINNGDSPATDVLFTTAFDDSYLSVRDASHPFNTHNGELEFDLGDMPQGSAVEVTYTAKVTNTDPGTSIINTAQVTGKETDNNTLDNTEVLTIVTDQQRGNGIRVELGNGSSVVTQDKQDEDTLVPLLVSRLTPHAVVHIGSESTQEKLLLKNDTDTVAKNVVLHDVLTSESGKVIRDEVWELGDVLPGEEISLGYEIMFNPNAAYGVYTLQTRIEGENVRAVSVENGEIVYEIQNVPSMPLVASQSTNDDEGFRAAGFMQSGDVGDVVYSGEETPLIPIPAFATKVAQASENAQLASVALSGFALDPIMLFFAVAFVFFIVSLVRLYIKRVRS